MYGLPADLDASIFASRELVQVSFTVNTVHLVFDGDISVTIEGSFLLRQHPEAEALKQAPPVKSSPLMSLVGRRVVAGRKEGNGTLTLEFEDGGMLACLDDSREYESYRIQIPGREIVV